MARRGHQEGTIYQRSDGRWEARVTLPDGTRKSLYAATRSVAAKRMREAQDNLSKGVMPPKDGILLRATTSRGGSRTCGDRSNTTRR